MGTVLLVRHGETTWNRDGKIQGWADSALTDRGRRQARALGDRLAGAVDRLVVSNLARTRETAAVLADAGVDASSSVAEAWRERDFGAYQGLTRSEIAARHPTFDPDDSLIAVESVPEGESRAALTARVEAGLDALETALEPGETAVVVTHGGPIRVALASVTGRALPALASEWSPDNCGVTALDLDGARSVVTRDDTTHLDPL